MIFHLDEDQSHRVRSVAEARYSLGVTTTRDERMSRFTDREQLAFAGREGRCIVTRNGAHFIALTAEFLAEGLPHAGVLIVPRSMENHEYDRIARALAWFHHLYPGGVPAYFVGYLQDPPSHWETPEPRPHA
jgi:hypothetical protein